MPFCPSLVGPDKSSWPGPTSREGDGWTSFPGGFKFGVFYIYYYYSPTKFCAWVSSPRSKKEARMSDWRVGVRELRPLPLQTPRLCPPSLCSLPCEGKLARFSLRTSQTVRVDPYPQSPPFSGEVDPRRGFGLLWSKHFKLAQTNFPSAVKPHRCGVTVPRPKQAIVASKVGPGKPFHLSRVHLVVGKGRGDCNSASSCPLISRDFSISIRSTLF